MSTLEENWLRHVQRAGEQLSDGAIGMLMHIARVCPLAEPFPSFEAGQLHLRELIDAALIANLSATEFCTTYKGSAVVTWLIANGPSQADAAQSNDPKQVVADGGSGGDQ